MERKASVDRNVCVACGACAKVCPKGAISVWKGCYAQVTEDVCVGCGLCARTCPAGCIAVKEGRVAR
ncbi:MAG: 4Fe-4S binding protein [Dysosmobacter sp.]|nr:4Fe-4S binding protein [Dysosmobacter sp.]